MLTIYRTTLWLFIAMLILSMPAAMADARGFSMASTGTATGDPLQAGALNPALLAHKPLDSQFSLVFPSFALEVSDPDNAMDRVRDLQHALDELETLFNQEQPDQEEIDQARETILERYDATGGNITLEGQVYGQLAFPGQRVAMGVYFSVSPSLYTQVSQDPDDRILLETATSPEQLHDLRSEGMVIGTLVAETGMIFASRFDLASGVIGVGITPKVQRIEAFAYNESVAEFSDRNYDQRGYFDNESAFNMDLGITWFQGPWKFGLSARNLFTRSVRAPVQSTQILTTNGELDTRYEFRPEVTVGAGWVQDNWTLSFDVDLTRQRYLNLDNASQSIIFGESRYVQFAKIGGSWQSEGRWKLRAGYRHDLQSTFDNAVTAGLAVTTFNRLTADFGLLYSGSRSLGGSMQLAFRF